MKNDLTHKQLTKKIGQYSALAAAFMSTASVAHADAVFTDVDPDEVVNSIGEFDIDFDGDGVVDASPFASIFSTFFGGSNNYVAVDVGTGGNAVLGTSLFNVYVLNAGDPVSAGQPFDPQGTGYPNVLNTNSTYGNWTAGTAGYVGVQFDISGNTHYGWIELTVNSDSQVTIMAHGYNDTPGETILAGEMPVTGPGGPAVPTMSQWGLITFALMMLSFGTIAIGRKKRIMPDGTTVDMGMAHEFRNPPFSAAHFKKATLLTLGLIGLATTGTLLAYGSIALVDIIGFSIASPIFAYLAHLTMVHNEEWKNK